MIDKKYFSGSTGGFYSDKIHGKGKPDDCIELTDVEYQSLLDLNAQGKVLQVNGGIVEAVDPPPVELTYDQKRKRDYGSVQDQLDMIYWDQVNGTTIWRDHVTAVKAAHPKPV